MAQTDLHFSFEPAYNSAEDASKHMAFDVVEFTLTEALNTPFVLEVELLSADPSVDFSKLMDQPVLFTIWQGSTAVRHVHGLISNFSQRDTGFRRTRYFAVVEPALTRTQLGSDWRIFQQKTIPEVISEVFKSAQISNYSLTAEQMHLQREYCVQAGNETDFEFLQRAIAEEGFVYCFEHNERGHQLLLTDVVQTLGALQSGTVLYQPKPAGDRPQPALRTFTYQEKVRTARQTQRDYTFKNPRYNQQQVSVGRDMPTQSTAYERYDYPGRYKQDAAGAPFTQTKLQSLRRDAKLAIATGDDARIQPGVAFELTGHPRSELNTLWRPVKVAHSGKQHTSGEEEAANAQASTSYQQTAELVPATAEWKAPIPAKPHLHGPEIAHVVGPQGEEIYTDEHGRVKVQFPWDRIGSNDEHSTCWIRVAQNWAGAGWGHIAIPRIGQEVIVDFLDGDPDQPIITGRAYDASHPTPYKLPALKTQQTVKSKEHKGGGYNELLIDDTTGEIKTQLHSTHGVTQLTMGYLTHPRKDDGSGEHRGDGFEVRTDEWGAIRAGKGLYISTDKRQNAQGKQLDLQEAIAQLQNALTVAQDLERAAQTAQADPSDINAQEQQLNKVYTDLQAPGILVSSPYGVAVTTPANAQVSAEQGVQITSAQNTDVSSIKNFTVAAGKRVSLLAVDEGMKLIANKGKVQVQAQHGEMELTAQDDLVITSTKGKTTIAAQKELLFTCGGAYIKLKDGKIELGSSSPLEVKTAGINVVGPNVHQAQFSYFPKAMVAYQKTGQYHGVLHLLDADQKPISGAVYKVVSQNGETLAEGVTDMAGKGMEAVTDAGPNATLFIGQGEWTISERILEDDEIGCGC
ncbi:Actin cross-linking toxin VgrG1 [Saezia sanguinis]|uniref:Actin cross-linking toxin VgrG1 n=1 Tax=Saezia sanguinis TaxID=1965230 RepID=A0A433SGV5_9BURK|nr:type VI secretion system tip protein TssI/VgrG [Saezia sanguinis]RUS67926.1 Actin cross-linking toxin VgrG1 [Saezia sanguinis]